MCAHVMLCVTFPLAEIIIGYEPVLYSVNEDVPSGTVDVFIRVIEGGDLTGVDPVPVNVSAESFTAIGLFAYPFVCLSVCLSV